MNTLIDKFQTLSEIDAPKNLHRKIMWRIYLAAWQGALKLAAAVSFGSLAFSALAILLTTEALPLMRLALEDIEWSIGFFADFSAMIVESIPMTHLFLFFVSLVCTIVLGIEVLTGRDRTPETI